MAAVKDSNSRTKMGDDVSAQLAPDLRRALTREILEQISSAEGCTPGQDLDPRNGPFVWCGSQFNTDLAAAADAELQQDTSMDTDESLIDMPASPMYRMLRDQFIQEACAQSEYAFMGLVWRAYLAGRLSPDRFNIRPEAERQLKRHEQHLSSKN